MRSRGHPASLRAAHHGPPVKPGETVIASTGPGSDIRVSADFDDLGDAFAWAIKNRERGELTVVTIFGKIWRYREFKTMSGKARDMWVQE